MKKGPDPVPDRFEANSEKTLSVLLVEDDAASAESLARLLRMYGCQVLIAADGLTAVELAKTHPLDVLLLDLGLPGINGWEVAKQVRAMHDHPMKKRPLLVAVTGLGQDEDRKRSEEAGIDLHLTKPVIPEDLLRLLGRFHAILFGG